VRRAIAVLVAVLVLAPSAHADDKDACIAAHETAQSLRNAGRVKDARKALITCARDMCPALISNDCKPWLVEANAEQPSVVLSVRDEHGTETADVRVTLDGVLLTEHLDGRPIDVDPGEHQLRFERRGVAPIEQKVFLHAKEKQRVVQVSFAPSVVVAPVAPVAHSRSRWSAGAVVTGILGIAGLGAFGVLGVAGKIDESNLSGSGCKPNCDAGKIDAIRNEYIAAYIALGVGALALGTSAVLLFTAPTTDGRGATIALTGRF
jgi:hypothetical protein